MRTERFKRGVVSILLVFVLVFSMISVAPLASSGDWVNRPAPGGEIIEVVQGENFLVRHVLEFDQPEDGAYTVTLSWLNYDNLASENLTFLMAEAYYISGPNSGENQVADVTLSQAPSGSDTIWALMVERPADNKDPRNGEFNVDIWMGAFGVSGVPHVPTDNHPIPHPPPAYQFAGVIVIESSLGFWNRAPITIRVLEPAYFPTKVIVRGKNTAYNVNNTAPPPWKTYDRGDLPPVMVAKRVGSGAAIAAGFAPGARDGQWNIPGNPDNHLPELLDVSFQWMVPGATTVLWYEGYGVFNNVGVCGTLVTALGGLGYTITSNSTEPITSSLLALYDIMVIPQMQLPYPPNPDYPSGNPDLLPDADVQAIEDFVNDGGGLLVMEGTDFFDYKYPEVQNKILLALGFDYLFQDDSVYDDTNNIAGATYRAIVDIDETTEIGAAYQSLTGKTTIGLYGYVSLAQAGAGVSVRVVSDYQVGMPGTTLEYDVVVFNPKNPAAENLTYDIIVGDTADWSLSVLPASLSVPVGENGTATLTVTVPSGTPLGTEDEIVVEAVALGYPEVRGSFTSYAYAGLSIKPTMDAYVSDAENDKAYGADEPLSLHTGRFGANWQNTYLQFDLSTIPSSVSITDARLYLFSYNVYGTQVPIAITEVDDDTWDELTITWNNKPENGPILDLRLVRSEERDFPISYSWDVTPFVDQEFNGDKIVSLSLRGLENHPISVNESFESKDWPFENRVRPFLRLSYTTEVIPATIGIKPDTLNLKSRARWITAYIELPLSYSVGDIDVGTVMLLVGNGNVPAKPKPTKVGDHDHDGIPDLKVRFERGAVQAFMLSPGEYILTIRGEVAGVPFEGSKTVSAITRS